MKSARSLIVSMIACLGLLTCTARGAVKTETVKYKAGQTECVGFLAYDDAASGKQPAVLVAPEWMGLNDYARSRAQQLAQMGYVAFAMDPYGGGNNAADVKEAAAWSSELKKNRPELRVRAAAALDVLKKHEKVDAAHIGAIGYCFGGTTVLELARSGADLAAVVSFHGGLVTDMPAPEGKVKARILVCHGADDPFVPPEEVDGFRKEMQTAKTDWILIAFGNAVHSFTNPNADKAGLKGVAYNEKADKGSWAAMKMFFDETLRSKSAEK